MIEIKYNNHFNLCSPPFFKNATKTPPLPNRHNYSALSLKKSNLPKSSLPNNPKPNPPIPKNPNLSSSKTGLRPQYLLGMCNYRLSVMN